MPSRGGSIARLLQSSFSNQVGGLQRTIRRDPSRIITWFEHWMDRRRISDFKSEARGLATDDSRKFRQLMDLYKAVFGKDPIQVTSGGSRSIRDWYHTMAELTMVVANKHSNSLLIRGSGGTGKTHTVLETLKKHRKGYALMRGYTTPVQFYNFMFDNRDGLILVDDCDEVFADITGLNILKAVLDTYEVRQVSWNSTSAVPRAPTFEFKGRIIFLTNLSFTRLNAHMEALLTRVLVYSIDLTPGEMLAQMRFMAHNSKYKSSTRQERMRVVSFLKKNQAAVPNMNLRHYIKGLDLLLYSKTRWRKLLMECW